jgi:hypothetical protein
MTWRKYANLSRREQREAVVRFRAQLRRFSHSHGGQWIGSLDCDEPGRPGIYDQWEEVRFLSRKSPKTIIWRAQIETAAQHFWRAVENAASDYVWQALSEAEIAAMPSWRSGLEVCERSSTGRPLSYRFAPRVEPTYERFEGRTRAEEIARIESELCASGAFPIYEQYVIDRKFEGALGVRVVVNVPRINRDVVDLVVERFLSMGETTWRSDVPVNRDALPTISYDQALQAAQQLYGVPPPLSN